MNRQEFKNVQNSFPLSTDTLDFMQDQTLLLQELTRAFGDNYIIKQPTVNNNGLIVIDGEIMPLALGAGPNVNYIKVSESSSNINANGILFDGIRKKRSAGYVTTNQGDGTYLKSTFFEIRKQKMFPQGIGYKYSTIYKNRISFLEEKQGFRFSTNDTGTMLIEGHYKVNENANHDFTNSIELVGTMPIDFPMPTRDVRITRMPMYPNTEDHVTDLLIKKGTRDIYHGTWSMQHGLFEKWQWINERVDMLAYF